MEYFRHRLPEGTVTYYVVKARDIEEDDNVVMGAVIVSAPPLPEYPSEEWVEFMDTVLVGYIGNRSVAEALNDEGWVLMFDDDMAINDVEVIMLNKYTSTQLLLAANYGWYMLNLKYENGADLPEEAINHLSAWKEAIAEYTKWVRIGV
jgi:uncharacterized protein (DUF2344 family)